MFLAFSMCTWFFSFSISFSTAGCLWIGIVLHFCCISFTPSISWITTSTLLPCDFLGRVHVTYLSMLLFLRLACRWFSPVCLYDRLIGVNFPFSVLFLAFPSSQVRATGVFNCLLSVVPVVSFYRRLQRLLSFYLRIFFCCRLHLDNLLLPV